MTSERESADESVSSAPPESSPARPTHLSFQMLGVVALGGSLGTAARAGLGLGIPDLGSLPIATVAANIIGAFLLGVLLEALARRGRDAGFLRTARLFFGTGLMGGFTTYSALATDTAVLALNDGIPVALLYAMGTVVLGAAVTVAGIATSARLTKRAL